jgi:nicotinamidase-related amidase
MMYKLGRTDALIVVDVQNCFCAGGELPVEEGDKIIPIMNKYIQKFQEAGAKIYATRDWHPPNHKSFKEYGGIWPPHCLKGSKGAEFHPDLKLPEGTTVISAGDKPSVEGYSGFDHTDLERKLKGDGVDRVFVGGLATDYCVKYTVLDAVEKNFETILLMDAIKGVNREPGDAERAIDEMVKKGAKKATLPEIE